MLDGSQRSSAELGGGKQSPANNNGFLSFGTKMYKHADQSDIWKFHLEIIIVLVDESHHDFKSNYVAINFAIIHDVNFCF